MLTYNLIMFSRHNVVMCVWLFILLPGLLLVACQENAPAPAAEPSPIVALEGSPTTAVSQPPLLEITSPTPTAVPPTPTPTPEPLAALVNNQPIYLDDYEKELARYEQALLELGQEPEQNYRSIVLEALIDRLLIMQAAADAGLAVTPEMVEEKLAELRNSAQSEADFNAWLEANQWSEVEFRQALAAEMLTALMRDRVTANVPFAAEQVRARYIQVVDAALAEQLLAQIRAGADFANLARQYSRDPATAPSGGELGFFARGSLLVPELEEAAMSLQPGETSEVIAVTGADGSQIFYLIQVIERDPQRPLSASMRYTLLTQAFTTWLQQQRSQANVQRFVNTE